MAFTIRIFEKNEYIYRLLKKRLGCFYPEAYIVNPYIDEQDYEERFSDFTRVLYDPANIDEEEIADISSPIRLTEDGGIIDCARLISLLMPTEDTPSFTKTVTTGSITAVIPFVYSDVRDNFIRELYSGPDNAGYNIRLDFTSKLRSLWHRSSGCNMTALLEACKQKRFVPEDILKYCNMDDYGFLTPGSTANYDDVYDLGVGRSITLINHAADLAHSRNRSVNVLAVMEGFRTNDLPELLANCDKVYILLPARNAAEDLGARELINLITRTLGQERVSVYYAEDFTTHRSAEENIVQRRLVV